MFNKYIPFRDLMLKTQHPFSHLTKLPSRYIPQNHGCLLLLSSPFCQVSDSQSQRAGEKSGSEPLGDGVCPSSINRSESSRCPSGLPNELQGSLGEYALSIIYPRPRSQPSSPLHNTISKTFKISVRLTLEILIKDTQLFPRTIL